ncbi:WD40 repeat-like protein [Suillus weaverae]|nr:WD40 repeat-like protein [Suillus weaverae]
MVINPPHQPSKYILNEKEFERVSALARIEIEDTQIELECVHNAAKGVGKGTEGAEADDADEMKMYGSNEDALMEVDGDVQADVPEKEDDLAQYNLDKYDEDDVKEDAFRTRDPPNVTTKTEDDVSQLEIYVYENPKTISTFTTISCSPTSPSASTSSEMQSDTLPKFGNYIAFGTLDPEIEIWSLDVMESMHPDMILGRPDKTAVHVPVPAGTDTYHIDAVLGLSWNRSHRHMLASASAHCTVKLWDLSRPIADGEGVMGSFGVHKDKVQAVQWNEKEPTVHLASDTGVGAVLGADVKALRWDPWETHAFYVSLENGLVLNFDARALPMDMKSPSPARFTLSAHDGAVSAFDVSPLLQGCICMGGMDKLVKLWNVDQTTGGKPAVSMVVSKDMEVVTVFLPDDHLTIAAAGSKAKLQIWDVGASSGA